MNSTDADIIITFAPIKHRLFEGDHHFNPDSLAHAHFPENGDIHLNDNVKWSLSFKNEPNTINMFYVITHEIGHSLGLNHINDVNSIMYPAYISKNYDAFNFTFDSIDEKLIKTMYSKYYSHTPRQTTEPISTTFSTTLLTTERTTPTVTQTISTRSYTSTPKTGTEDYPDFSLCKNNDEIDWCNDNLIFNLVYDIDGYLFLYKSIDFWIYTDRTGIKRRIFNHFNFWGVKSVGLISIVKIEKDFVLFHETFSQILSCNKGEEKLDYKKINITYSINGIYYNHTSDILYLFSKETPKTYYKVINSTKNAKTLVKPISLWKMNIFNYDIVFSRNNTVYFVKGNIVDYFDMKSDNLIKGLEFRDLFLRDQCSIFPLIH